jgi:hypothetical protein
MIKKVKEGYRRERPQHGHLRRLQAAEATEEGIAGRIEITAGRPVNLCHNPPDAMTDRLAA